MAQPSPPAVPPAGLPSPGQHPEICYAIRCDCGHLLQGIRGAKYQVIPCPACRSPLFVLPRGPYSPPGSGWDLLGPGLTSAGVPRRLLLALLGGLGLALLVTFVVLRNLLSVPQPASGPPPGTSSLGQRVQTEIDAGQAALREGSLHLARERFETALRLYGEDPGALGSMAYRQLSQQQRQTALLTDLLPLSLEELLRRADASPSEAAWQAQLKREFLGKGVIFDDEVAMDVRGQPALVGRDRIEAGDVSALVRVQGLEMLHHLPLRPTRRWIFGARLSSLTQEEGATWVVRLQPDSGVLFDSLAALKAWNPRLEGDAELGEVLERQAACLRDMPAPRPMVSP